MNQTKGDVNYTPPNTKPIDQLTPDQVYREVMAVKELMTIHISSIVKAIDVAHEDMVRFPTEVEKQIKHLNEVIDLRFANVERQLKVIELARVEQKTDTQTAVGSAFNAAKEAVNESNKSSATAILKSENAFAEQIKQQALQIQIVTKSFEERVNDLKDRIGKIEGVGEGKRMSTSALISLIVVSIAVLGFIFNLINTQ